MFKGIIAAAVMLLFSAVSFAQNWEIGGFGGWATQMGSKSKGSAGEATVGFKDGFVGGAYGGNESFRFWSGELRYLYRNGAAQVDGDVGKASLSAHQHQVTYDVLGHFVERGNKVRPFIAFGGGVKYAKGTGAEAAVQPGSQYALLTATSQILPVVSLGGGVKVKVTDNFGIRFDFRDYISPAPDKILYPAQGQSIKGWMHDLTFMVGLSYLW
jgi:hypothetical protein